MSRDRVSALQADEDDVVVYQERGIGFHESEVAYDNAQGEEELEEEDPVNEDSSESEASGKNFDDASLHDEDRE